MFLKKTPREKYFRRGELSAFYLFCVSSLFLRGNLKVGGLFLSKGKEAGERVTLGLGAPKCLFILQWESKQFLLISSEGLYERGVVAFFLIKTARHFLSSAHTHQRALRGMF